MEKAKILKNYYDNDFSLKISEAPQPVKAVPAKEPAAVAKEPSALGAFAKEATAGAPGKEAAAGAAAKATKPPVSRPRAPGAIIELMMTVYPNKKDDTMIYYQNLHMFKTRGWFSLGIKPKAKDLKTFIDDLSQIDYLASLDESSSVRSTVVLDGSKVRLGFDSNDLDPLNDEGGDMQALVDLLNQLKVEEVDHKDGQEDTKSVCQAEFEAKITIGQRLSEILDSVDPIVVSLFKSLSVEASLKFHHRQFQHVLTATTGCKYRDYIGGKEAVEVRSDHHTEAAESEAKSEEDEEEEDHNEYGDYNSETHSEEEDIEEKPAEEAKQGGFDIKTALMGLLPFFLFKWNADITMTPDLQDIREFCSEKQSEAFILQNFKQITDQGTPEDGTADAAQLAEQKAKKGSKAELIAYLVEQVGTEIDFVWKTRYFYITGKINADDLGSALGLISKANLLQ